MVTETVLKNQFFIFFSLLKMWVNFLQSLIARATLCLLLTPSNDQMKTKMNVVTVVMKLRSGVFEWCVTSPLYVNNFFVSTQLIWCLRLQCGTVIVQVLKVYLRKKMNKLC
jgi:hypothetical protein